jgi:branched-subunit amino acid ABC-type transport system permease component
MWVIINSMSNLLIAFICAFGAGVWISKWFYGRTGGDSQKSYITGAIAGVFVFIILIYVLSLVG